MFNVPIVHLPLSQFFHHHEPLVSLSMLQKTRTRGMPYTPHLLPAIMNQKWPGGNAPHFCPIAMNLKPTRGAISKHNDKTTEQQCILPSCFVARLQQETQKQGKKEKHVHSQTTGATTKQKRKHKREKKSLLFNEKCCKKTKKRKEKWCLENPIIWSETLNLKSNWY